VRGLRDVGWGISALYSLPRDCRVRRLPDVDH
jgi:hypothetical protein